MRKEKKNKIRQDARQLLWMEIFTGATEHYWDSLEKDKNLILKHLEGIKKWIEKDSKIGSKAS